MDEPTTMTSFGDYETEKRLETTAFSPALVYIARRRAKGEGRVVLKVWPLDGVHRHELHDHYAIHELRALRALSHRRLVSAMAASFVHADAVCLPLATAELGSARELLLGAHPHGLPEHLLVALVRPAVEALDYLHTQNWLHRALCARHLLLGAQLGDVRLTGLGHARQLPATQPKTLHHFDRDLESLLFWLAPEVLRQDVGGYGIPSDVYSLGALLCELTNGFPPFEDMPTLQQLYEKQCATQPRLLDATTLPPDCADELAGRRLSPELHSLVALCLAADPTARPTTAWLLHHTWIARTTAASARSSSGWFELPSPSSTQNTTAAATDFAQNATTISDPSDTRQSTTTWIF